MDDHKRSLEVSHPVRARRQAKVASIVLHTCGTRYPNVSPKFAISYKMFVAFFLVRASGCRRKKNNARASRGLHPISPSGPHPARNRNHGKSAKLRFARSYEQSAQRVSGANAERETGRGITRHSWRCFAAINFHISGTARPPL